MTDYQGNSNKSKMEQKVEDKKIEKVVKGAVIVQKKSIGRKIKEVFIEADFKSVVRYVIHDIMIPAAKNMIVDSSQMGVERMMYGETRRNRYSRPGSTSHFQYNNPTGRGYRSDYSGPLGSRQAPRPTLGPRSTRQSREDFILSSREEAELVLERMNDIIDKYEVASVADLNDLVGFPTNYVDHKLGWVYLGDVQIRQIREGFLIELPPAEPIS